MGLSSKQLNRATLGRQLLLRRERLPVGDAVRRVVALQAQEPASAYVALWSRLAGFDPAELDAAFAERAVVKATLMRIALHAVHAEDYTAFHEAMLASLRAAGLNDRRFTSTGLSTADVDALVPHLVKLTSRRPCSVVEIDAMLATQLGAPPERGVWRALKTFAPLVHAPVGGSWSFGQKPLFRAAPSKPPRLDADRSLQWLVRRYLEGFGPASAKDFGQFAMQRQPAIQRALRAMADNLVTLEGPAGELLFDVPGAPLPDEDTPAPPRLLAMWDSILLAYSDRSRVIPADYRQAVIRRNGDVLPTLLVDGYVCGVWRPVDDGIEARAFHRLADEAWDGLATEARALLAVLAERQPPIYRRFAHWWSTVPGADTRFLAR